MRKNLVTCVRGNHDYIAVTLEDLDIITDHAKVSLIWTNKQLTPTNKKFLKELPLTKKVGDIFVVHGSPFDPLYEYVYEDDEMEYFVKSAGSKVLVMAHTHLPFVKMVKKTLIINPGSGQPKPILYTLNQVFRAARVKWDVSLTEESGDAQ